MPLVGWGYRVEMASDQKFTIDSARDAEGAGTLGSWVESFLASDGSDNAELGKRLRREFPLWFGPILIPFDRLNRLAGPPDQPTLERLDHDDLESVESMQESIEDGWSPPPFVATWNDDHLMLEDGNHRVEGIRRSGEGSYWCVVGVATDDDRRLAQDEIDEAR